MKKFISSVSLVVSGVVCLYIAYMTGTGEILNYIPFAGPMNEMAFCGVSSLTGVGCLISGINAA
jgi:hypothetical protein